MQAQRGCNKPGSSIKGKQAFRFTSPMLGDGDRVLRECPVGRVLREAPSTYEVLRAASYADQAGPSMLRESRYLQRIASIVASEKARLSEIERKQHQAGGDAAFAARTLKGR